MREAENAVSLNEGARLAAHQVYRQTRDLDSALAAYAAVRADAGPLPVVREEDIALMREKLVEAEDWKGPQRDCPNYTKALARERRILAILEGVKAQQDGAK